MPLNDKLLWIIGNIYAELDQEPDWHHLLSALCQLAKCSTATLDVFGFSPQSIQYSVSLGMDPEIDTKYLEHYSSSDDKVPRALARGGHGVLRDCELLTASEIKHSPAYNELWKPNQLENQLHCFSKFNNDSAIAISLMTGNKRDPFNTETIKFCETVLPHVTRAIRIQAEFMKANLVHSVKSNLVQELNQGIVLINGNRQVVYINDAGENMCNDKDGLRYSDFGLCVMDSKQDKDFKQILSTAILIAKGVEHQASVDFMCVKRPSGKQPYLLFVTPVSNQVAFLGWQNAACAIIRITDPGQEPATSPQILKQLFGLTPAEAKLAELLMSGKHLNEIAASLAITIGTARNHLKSIFQKTCTKSQGQLISLMLRTLSYV